MEDPSHDVRTTVVTRRDVRERDMILLGTEWYGGRLQRNGVSRGAGSTQILGER